MHRRSPLCVSRSRRAAQVGGQHAPEWWTYQLNYYEGVRVPCMMVNVMIEIMQCQYIPCWSMWAGGGDDSSPRPGGTYFSSLRNSHSRNTVMHFDSAKLCAAINTWLASVASQGSHPEFPGTPLRDGAEEADPEMAAGRWRHWSRFIGRRICMVRRFCCIP